MSAMSAGGDGREECGPVTVLLPRETVDRLLQYCADYEVTPDEVVDRALKEYFLEGDLSH